MIQLRPPSKKEILYGMFPEVGDEHTVEEVFEKTGISTDDSLKVTMNTLKNLPDGLAIDLSRKNGTIMRVG